MPVSAVRFGKERPPSIMSHEDGGRGASAIGNIECVAIVSPSNAPLFIQRYRHKDAVSSETGRHLHEIVYNSLDVIEEATKSGSGKERIAEPDGFVGCLAMFGTLALYGSVTNGGYKMVIAVRDARESVDRIGGPLRTAFQRVGHAVVAALLDPMHDMDAPLGGKRVAQLIGDAVASYS